MPAACSSALEPVDPFTQNMRIGRAVDIIGYDPIRKSMHRSEDYRLGDSWLKVLDWAVRTAEKLGWSWAHWQFDRDFILYDIEKGQWVEPIRDALIPR
jgi:hypothetical protein